MKKKKNIHILRYLKNILIDFDSKMQYGIDLPNKIFIGRFIRNL